MAIFSYKGIDKKGKEHAGTIDADSNRQALQMLKAKGLTPFELFQQEFSRGAKGKAGLFSFLTSGGSVNEKEISAFTREFATMIDAGIPYNRALEIIVKDMKSKKLRMILADIRSKIIEGGTLAGAMSDHPKVFKEMYIAMVHSGEQSGQLASTLLNLTDFQEEQQALQARVQTATIYPIIMSVLGVGIVIFMIKFILPRIVPVFEHFNVVLPLPTRIVIGMSDFFSNYGMISLFLLAALLLGLKKYTSTENGKYKIDKLKLAIPVLGEFNNKLLIYRFAHNLGTLLSSGVEIRGAMKIVMKVTGNKVYENSIRDLSEVVTKKGFSLSQGLTKASILNESTIQMIRVGEETGNIEQMLEKISQNLEREVKTTLEKTIAFLEPIIILVMALVVGFIVLAIMLPIFEMNQLV